MNQMMKNKKAIALLLLVAMLFSIMPTAVFAAETGSTSDTITAYVTIVDQGNVVVMHKEVQIKDRNNDGKCDIDEALYATHETYYPGGAEAGYQQSDGWISMLWGSSSGCMYRINNISANGLTDSINQNDYLVAYNLKDTATWSDKYGYFNKHNVTTNSSLTLKLMGCGWGEPFSIPKSNITVNGSLVDTTDDNGEVTLLFEKEGTYTISATTESMILVPPVCVVTYDKSYVADEDDNDGNISSGENEDNEGVTDNATIKDIPELMENIASGYVEASNKWNVMDMGTYSKLNGAQYSLSEVAKQKYINTVIKNTLNGNYDKDNGYGLDQQNYSTEVMLPLTSIGVNAMLLYPENSNTALDPLTKLENTTPYISEWATPYTLMAYNQGYGTGENEIDLLTGLLALQNDDGGFGAYGSSVDSIGEILATLSFYRGYVDSTAGIDVEKSIDDAIEYLAIQVSEDGTYTDGWNGYNANSTAMAVIGLAAVFDIYDEKITSLFTESVEGLLSFAVNDSSGFWKAPDTSIANDKATEQGFRALIAASQVMKTGKAFNVYDFSGNTLKPGYEKEITPSGGSGSYVPKDDKIRVKVSIKAIDGYWMQNKSVTLEEDATVSDALLKAIKGTGITQVGAENGYIESMEYNGMELGEFTHGDFSGWMYKVNGTAPNVGVTDYSLRDGDKILFYFTKDYTNESMEEDEEKDEDKKDEESKPTTTPVNEVFKDVDTHWASASIQFVYDNGILKGVSATDFAPEATFNRAMMATVLHRLAGNPEHGWHYPFRDVFDMAWYCGPIAWAYENNLIGGMTTTSYAPESPITREQLAVMLMRYAQFQGYDTSKSVALYQYQDAGKVSDYAQPAMEWAVSIGLIGGRTLDTLAPQDTATRAEVSVMLERFITMFQPVVEEESTIK